MTNKFTADDVGVWIDGNRGQHAHVIAVDIAVQRGFTLTEEDRADLEACCGGQDDADGMPDQGGLLDRATDYLDSLAPEGFHVIREGGELGMYCACQVEGTEENLALLATGQNQCESCKQRAVNR